MTTSGVPIVTNAVARLGSRRPWASKGSRLALGVASVLLLSTLARAQLHLTPTGTSRGFLPITTFASGFTFHTGGSGPGGVAYRTHTSGLIHPELTVLVSDVDSGSGCTVYLLNNNDNQVSPYPVAAHYPNLDAIGLAQIQVGPDYKYYMGQVTAKKLVEINSDAGYVQDIVSFADSPLGIAPYPPQGAVGPLTGHLFVTAGADIWDVDPQAHSKTLFNHSASATPDGLSFDASGATVYVPYTDGVIRAFDTSTATLTWTSAFIAGGPDGTAIGVGTLTGYIYVNCNSGDVWELGVPPHTLDVNHIATGGTRGDFIAADPNIYSGGGYPSLLLIQTDSIMRLDPPGGGFFGPPTSSTDPVLCTTCFPRLCEPGIGGVSPCPCSNPAIGPGRGCNNFGPNPAGGSGGASLEGSGVASIANDSVLFQVTDEISNASNITIIWQGTGTLALGAQSGAGERCVAGNLRRIYTGNAANGAISFPSGSQPNVHTASSNHGFPIVPPITLYYYAAYRNAAAGTPCGSPFFGFNTTNAAAVSWTP
jgi:DNA-binding beta-propeller fold protein YncE